MEVKSADLREFKSNLAYIVNVSLENKQNKTINKQNKNKQTNKNKTNKILSETDMVAHIITLATGKLQQNCQKFKLPLIID